MNHVCIDTISIGIFGQADVALMRWVNKGSVLNGGPRAIAEETESIRMRKFVLGTK